MKNSKLEGVIIAMPTPLNKNEEIDVASLHSLLDYCISEGTNGIMILGTMGEGPALVESQKQLMVTETVNHTAGRIPILATVSEVSTKKSIAYAKSIDQAGVTNEKEKVMRLQHTFHTQLMELLSTNPARNWMFNIKKRLADMSIISHPYVTAPFLSM